MIGRRQKLLEHFTHGQLVNSFLLCCIFPSRCHLNFRFQFIDLVVWVPFCNMYILYSRNYGKYEQNFLTINMSNYRTATFKKY
jgi:hypothetical protein